MRERARDREGENEISEKEGGRERIQQQPDGDDELDTFLGETKQVGKSGSNNTRNLVQSSNVAECRSASILPSFTRALSPFIVP